MPCCRESQRGAMEFWRTTRLIWRALCAWRAKDMEAASFRLNFFEVPPQTRLRAGHLVCLRCASLGRDDDALGDRRLPAGMVRWPPIDVRWPCGHGFWLRRRA